MMISHLFPKLPYKNQYTKSTILILLSILVFGCTSVKQLAIEKDVNRLLNQSDVFSNQFTGFSLYDIESEKFLAGHNSNLKFTPASNTKLLTMYAVLKSFPENIPSLIYKRDSTGITVQPLGDPTFLYRPFKTQKIFDFLKKQSHINITWPKESLEPFGSGWAWDDYTYDFQAQRSWWPIYGNVLTINKVNDSLSIIPSFLSDYVDIIETSDTGERISRDLKFNTFNATISSDTSDFQRVIPFEYSQELLLQLLHDTLGNSVQFSQGMLIEPDTLFSYPTDLALAQMMKPSDNFLAEQLLIMAARIKGYDEIKPFIFHVKNTWLANLSDIVWVDGSGLSRYNLISPIDQIRLLKNCYYEFGWDRITSILPTGGEGTLREYYLPTDDDAPYIFAKTGTLSNNHNLSGFLITRSGKRMIFSFMNNHYTKPTTEIKQAMEQFLIEIRNAY